MDVSKASGEWMCGKYGVWMLVRKKKKVLCHQSKPSAWRESLIEDSGGSLCVDWELWPQVLPVSLSGQPRLQETCICKRRANKVDLFCF